jgi:hypothetical protein
MFIRLAPVPFQLPGLSVRLPVGVLFSSLPFYCGIKLWESYRALAALSSFPGRKDGKFGALPKLFPSPAKNFVINAKSGAAPQKLGIEKQALAIYTDIISQ